MIDPRNLDTLLHPQFDAASLKRGKMVGRGLPASPGAACGKIVFTAADAKAWHERGEKVVLVRLETSPEDIEGMKAAEGILTVRGGMTSHAAVVARGMGECCVSGCTEIHGRVLRLGLHRDRDGRGGQDLLARRQDLPRGRLALDRRRHGRDLRRRRDDRRRAHRGRVRPHHDVGGQVPQAPRPHERRHAARRPQGARARRRGHRPVPHGAHVLRAGPHRRVPRDDLRRHRGGAPHRALEDPPVPADRLRGALRGARGAPRHDPLPRPAAARVPAAQRGRDRAPGEGAAQARHAHQGDHRLAARVQPDDGPPRLPPVRDLPGDRSTSSAATRPGA